MDESIRLYQPKDRRIENLKESLPIYAKEVNEKENLKKEKSEFQKKWESRAKTMVEAVKENEQKIRNASFRHPWFNLMYNWIIVFAVIGLIVSAVVWGLDIRTNRIAEELTTKAMADYQAEQDAIETARLEQLAAEEASMEVILKREATDGAKMIYGIRNFIDKYGYGERDLRTYIRCALDRVDFGNGVNDLHAIVSQEGQFLAYDENNPVIDEYYQIAYQEIQAWHTETSKPWDSSFRFAELTPEGIFLTSEFGVDGYARRVRY